MLSQVAAAFRKETPLLYADIHYEKTDGTRGRHYSGRPFAPAKLKQGFMPPHPSVYVRTGVYRRHGLFREDMTVAADFEWLVRVLLSANEKATYLPLDMVAMHTGGVSESLRRRLFLTPKEKWRALRLNGHRVCPLRLLGRYIYLFKK